MERDRKRINFAFKGAEMKALKAYAAANFMTFHGVVRQALTQMGVFR